MNLLYVTSHKFCTFPDGIYSPGQYPYAYFERFFTGFTKIDVLARRETDLCGDSSDNQNLSTGPGITFHLFDAGLNFYQRFTSHKKAKKLTDHLLEKADAVVVRNTSLGWLVAKECEKRSIPWAIEVVGDIYLAYRNHGKITAQLFAPIAEHQARKWVSRAPFAHYVTDRYLQEKYPTKGRKASVSNVMISEAESDVLNQKISRLSSLSKNEPIRLGFNGILSNKQKGLLTAFKALSHAKPQLPPFTLHVIGKGDTKAWQKKAAEYGLEKEVHFDGLLKGGVAVLRWFDGIDLYLHPSHNEGLPRSVIEAMSRGCPVLASDAGGIPEIIAKECLHPAGSWKILSEQLSAIQENREFLISQAVRNFRESASYRNNLLAAKRETFWEVFAAFAGGERIENYGLKMFHAERAEILQRPEEKHSASL